MQNSVNNSENQKIECSNPQGNVPEQGTPPPPVAGNNTNTQTDSQNAVRTVRDLLGDDVVLLPVVRGQKRPSISDWQNVTLASMSDPAYLAQLEAGNIGVLLGSPSGGLCAIDIDDDAEVEPFLALNPQLRQTLRTRGARGAQIWMRIAGTFPKLTKLKDEDGGEWGEWRADGGQSVIHGEHPSGVDYTIVENTSPITLHFEDIKWPENLELPWVKSAYDLLVEQEGDPFAVSKGGAVTLNFLFFVRKYTLEHHVIYDSTLGEFFEYNSGTGLWKQQTVEALKRRFNADLTAAAKLSGLDSLFYKRTDATVSGLVALLKSEVEEYDAFTNRPPAIHVANGMICFDGDEVTLQSFHPDFRSRNACPFAFDPNAECPRFKTELLGAALNEEDIALLQKWAGSVLLGRNPAQRFLLMLGMPNGGKSTAMTILERTIGLVNVAQIRTEHLGKQFELYSFVGKTLLTGKDVAANFLTQKGAHGIKSLVGGDLLDAEKKGFNKRVQIRGDFNIGITCNTDLNIRLEGDVGAWRRRMLVLKYDRPAPTQRIADFPELLLRDEGPGILRWMVEGAIAATDDINATGDYCLTEEQKARVNRLLDQSDSVRQFVHERLNVTPAADATVKEINAAYYDYCDAKGWNPLPGGEVKTQLSQAILEIHRMNPRHDIKRSGGDQRGYMNLMILENR
jgi:phage/plasmid-associated DNA primase